MRTKCVYCIKMEFQKIAIFLDITPDDKNFPKFVTKKWIEVYDQSGRIYNVNEEIRIKKSMLRLDLYDYSDAYIVVKGDITVDKKAFTADDIEEPNNTANDNAFGEKSWFLKTMLNLSIAFQKLM